MYIISYKSKADDNTYTQEHKTLKLARRRAELMVNDGSFYEVSVSKLDDNKNVVYLETFGK